MSEEIVLTIITHPLWGYVLQPLVVKREEAIGAFRILEVADSKTPLVLQSDDKIKKIVSLTDKITDKALLKTYSKEKNVSDFHKNVTQENIDRYIRPFIESCHEKIINLFLETDIHLYIRASIKVRLLYPTERVTANSEISRICFYFKRDESKNLSYFIRVKWGNQELNLLSQTHFVLCSDPAVLVVGDKLLVFKDIDKKKLLPFFSKTKIEIPISAQNEYMRKFVRKCVEEYEVKAEGISIDEINPSKKAILSLEQDWNNRPALFLLFNYNGTDFLPDAPYIKNVIAEERNGEVQLGWFYRDQEWEISLIKLLEQNGLAKTGLNSFTINKIKDADSNPESIELMVDWLTLHQDDIIRYFDFSQKYLSNTYYLGEINIRTNVNFNNDWFDLYAEVAFGEFVIPFADFRKHILNEIREYVLPDGSIAILPQEWFAQYADLMSFSNTSESDHLLLKKSHFNLLDSVVNSNKLTSSFSFDKNHILDNPKDLCGQLRNYQQYGYSWMVYLYENNFGGCLADDMGLGKTIQTISLLLYIKEKQKSNSKATEDKFIQPEIKEQKQQLTLFDQPAFVSEEIEEKLPSLILLPTSLIHNWYNELKRFAPSLSVYVYTGNKRVKAKDSNFRLFDLIITTYGTLRNDIDLFSKCYFHHLILDESQYVKNPSSDIHVAIKQINALHKLALTGTPIENSLVDLWSLFDILNEGMLGNLTSFKKRYVNTINKEDKKRDEKLLKMIQPFILRRTKEQVIPELPPLQEEIVYCDMTAEQQEFYANEKNKLRNQLIEQQISQEAKQMSFVMLQGLTKLRLLANHPVLTDVSYSAKSGKFDEIISRIITLKEENHKVLVFSSFVKHLHLLSDYFDEQEWDYAWLTGTTPPQEREKQIQKFMDNPSTSCFFVSLKAGGVGLNLTVADYVFILDPWWNPAAEMQALSRSHRIGQNKKVMAYRFITTNTIEEKIHKLQQQKSKLAQTFIVENNPLKALNSDEMIMLIE